MVAPVEEETGFHRLIMYKRSPGDNETESVVVDAGTATVLAGKGWQLSPYEYLDDSLKGMQAEAFMNELCRDLNAMLNLSLIDDKVELRQLSERFLGRKLNSKWGVKAMRRRIETIARAQGKFIGDDYESLKMEESR